MVNLLSRGPDSMGGRGPDSLDDLRPDRLGSPYVPGCPPRPEGLIFGMMQLQQLIVDRRGRFDERRTGPTVPTDI